MKRVVVTGATGFIGRHSLELLRDKGYEVYGISSRSIDATIHQVDLFNQQQVREFFRKVAPTHLLHFAWITTPGVYWTSEDNLKWVEASKELLRVFKDFGGTRAVVAGTCAEYDWSYGHCSEATTPLAPTGLYGKSKKELYEFMKTLDISWAWGRIFHLFGPDEPSKKLVASVILSLLKGEAARCTLGKQVRDYLYVRDVADAFVELLDSDVQGALNIGSGQPVTLETICKTIGEKMQVPEKVLLGAIPSNPLDVSILTADVGRLFNELQWKPKTTLAEGIDQTIEWAKSL